MFLEFSFNFDIKFSKNLHNTNRDLKKKPICSQAGELGRRRTGNEPPSTAAAASLPGVAETAMGTSPHAAPNGTHDREGGRDGVPVGPSAVTSGGARGHGRSRRAARRPSRGRRVPSAGHVLARRSRAVRVYIGAPGSARVQYNVREKRRSVGPRVRCRDFSG